MKASPALEEASLQYRTRRTHYGRRCVLNQALAERLPTEEIARLLGVNEGAVTRELNRLQIQPKPQRGRAAKNGPPAQGTKSAYVLQLLRRGLTDKAISERVVCSRQLVEQVRSAAESRGEAFGLAAHLLKKE